MFKKVILGVLGVCGIIGGSTLVFGTGFVFTPETHIKTVVSPNIYLWDKKLSETIIGYDSTIDIRGAKIHSLCNTKSEFIDKYESVYYFSLKYIGETCHNENIVLEYRDQYILSTSMKLNIVKKSDIFNLLTDYPSKDLSNTFRKLEKTVQKYAAFRDFTSEDIGKNISAIRKQRKYAESSYQSDMFRNIILWRAKKYTSPVPGKSLSKQFSKIPNAGRPYRESYTDGIHHGWDIDGKRGEQVVAIDDGVIIRVVSGFLYSDLTRIDHSENLTENQKLKNLDILRGNQVWLKTNKGEVIFYSHLDEVYNYVREGDMISRHTPLGIIGVSGVPQEDYYDYHLHFALQVNPYDQERAGTYDISDYMKWDWKFRGESFEYILKNQWEVFE